MKVFSKISLLWLFVAALTMGGKVSASVIYVDDFPSDESTRFSLFGDRFWNTGDFIQQLFSGTGLSEVNEFSLDLAVSGNILSRDTQDMAVLLNGIQIGDFMIAAGDTLVNIAFSGLNVTGVGATGDDYMLRLETTRTVAFGRGSARIDNNTGNLTLTQATQVSEPGVLALLVLGGFAAFRRQR